MSFGVKYRKRRQPIMLVLLCITFLAGSYYYFPVDWGELGQILIGILLSIVAIILLSVAIVLSYKWVKNRLFP